MAIKKNKVKISRLGFSLILVVFTLFLIKGFLFLDPDFGWRLVTGEIISGEGIPKIDPFTYTMPSFAWVDHAWSLSVLIYITHSLTGFSGLSLAFSLVAMASLLISAARIKDILKDSKLFEKTVLVVGGKRIPYLFSLPLNFKSLSYLVALPVILTASILFTFFGVRVQVFSWLMLSTLLYFLFEEKLWEKWKFALPFLFLIWANLHGSFAVGLQALSFFVFFRSIRLKKVILYDWVTLLTTYLVTLVNPYGVGAWREVYSSISDASLRWRIVEWMPALIMLDLAVVAFLGLSLGLFLKYKNHFRLEEKGLFVVFLIQAVLSRRHLPLWALISLPITMKGIYFVFREGERIQKGIERFSRVYAIGWLAVVVIVLIQAGFSLKEAYLLGRGGFYPDKAVAYLSQNLPEGEIFSEYGWGGFLIWKLPQKKVFIDGRMPSWRQTRTDSEELSSAFDTYEAIQRGETDYKEIFNSFGIDTVLWSKPREKTPLDELFESLEQSLKVFGWEPNDFSFLETLEVDGWRMIYEDETAVIYQPN